MTVTIKEEKQAVNNVEAADEAALSVGKRFLAALAARDFAGLEACFDTDVSFKALVPSGIREGIGPAMTVIWLRKWFEDADLFDVQKATLDVVVDRLHISYRIRLRKDGTMQTIEQQAYCVADGGRLMVMNLLCSGFRPEIQP